MTSFVFVVALATVSVPADPVVYSRPDGAFSAQVPKGWTIQEDDSRSTFISEVEGPTDRFRQNITISLDRLGAKQDPARVFEETRAFVAKAKATGVSEAVLPKVGRVIFFTTEQDVGVKVCSSNALLIAGRRTYSISGMDEVARCASIQALVKTVAQTLKPGPAKG